MRMNHKMRKTALTAMIALSLSSTGYAASASDGSVRLGSVTYNEQKMTTVGDINGDATFVTNGASIIEWQKFGIDASQKMTFDTTNGGLLNRVVGRDMSQILGTLVQKGDCPLLLVNPNGIVVGGTANIDASNLVLSTLALSDEEFKNLTDNKDASFVTDTKGAGRLNVENGAKIDIDSLLVLAGGSVEVADGVTFKTKANKDALVGVVAAQSFVSLGAENDNPQDRLGSGDVTKDNKAEFHGTFENLYNGSTGNTDFHVRGGVVNLDKATIHMNGNSEAYLLAGNYDKTMKEENTVTANDFHLKGGKTTVIAGGVVTLNDSILEPYNENGAGDINIYAGNKIEVGPNGDYRELTEADATNAIRLKNTQFYGMNKEIVLDAGAIVLEGSRIHNRDTISMRAFQTAQPSGDTGVITASASNSIQMKNSDINAKEVYLLAGKMELEKANLFAEGQNLTTVTGNRITATGIDSGHLALKVERDESNVQSRDNHTSISPLSAVSTPWTDKVMKVSLSDKDVDNISQGEAKMDEIIHLSKSFKEKPVRIQKFMAELNQMDAPVQAKFNVVRGMLKKIVDCGYFNDDEERYLKQVIMNAYSPAVTAVKQSEADNIRASSEVVNQTVDVQASQQATQPGEAADEKAVDSSSVE